MRKSKLGLADELDMLVAEARMLLGSSDGEEDEPETQRPPVAEQQEQPPVAVASAVEVEPDNGSVAGPGPRDAFHVRGSSGVSPNAELETSGRAAGADTEPVEQGDDSATLGRATNSPKHSAISVPPERVAHTGLGVASEVNSGDVVSDSEAPKSRGPVVALDNSEGLFGSALEDGTGSLRKDVSDDAPDDERDNDEFNFNDEAASLPSLFTGVTHGTTQESDGLAAKQGEPAEDDAPVAAAAPMLDRHDECNFSQHGSSDSGAAADDADEGAHENASDSEESSEYDSERGLGERTPRAQQSNIDFPRGYSDLESVRDSPAMLSRDDLRSTLLEHESRSHTLLPTSSTEANASKSSPHNRPACLSDSSEYESDVVVEEGHTVTCGEILDGFTTELPKSTEESIADGHNGIEIEQDAEDSLPAARPASSCQTSQQLSDQLDLEAVSSSYSEAADESFIVDSSTIVNIPVSENTSSLCHNPEKNDGNDSGSTDSKPVPSSEYVDIRQDGVPDRSSQMSQPEDYFTSARGAPEEVPEETRQLMSSASFESSARSGSSLEKQSIAEELCISETLAKYEQETQETQQLDPVNIGLSLEKELLEEEITRLDVGENLEMFKSTIQNSIEVVEKPIGPEAAIVPSEDKRLLNEPMVEPPANPDTETVDAESEICDDSEQNSGLQEADQLANCTVAANKKPHPKSAMQQELATSLAVPVATDNFEPKDDTLCEDAAPICDDKAQHYVNIKDHTESGKHLSSLQQFVSASPEETDIAEDVISIEDVPESHRDDGDDLCPYAEPTTTSSLPQSKNIEAAFNLSAGNSLIDSAVEDNVLYGHEAVETPLASHSEGDNSKTSASKPAYSATSGFSENEETQIKNEKQAEIKLFPEADKFVMASQLQTSSGTNEASNSNNVSGDPNSEPQCASESAERQSLQDEVNVLTATNIVAVRKDEGSELDQGDINTSENLTDKRSNSVAKTDESAGAIIPDVEPSPTQDGPTDDSQTVYMYVSMAAGQRGIIQKMNRAESILATYNVNPVVVELSMNASAKRLWKYQGIAKNKTLPALVRDREIKMDFDELIEANEMEEVLDILYDD